MGEGWTALLAAVVGVVGTLGAALLTQSRADRSRRVEIQTAAELRHEERDHAEAVLEAERAQQQAEESVTLRRTCYITLNTSARRYLTAQVDVVHALRDGADVEGALERLETRRTELREIYAEAQMIVPPRVMAVARLVSRRLNTGYGQLKKIAVTTIPYDEENLRGFEAQVEQSWAILSEMRYRMRLDLAIDDPPAPGTAP